MGIPVCQARQEFDGRGDVYYCRHPRMHAPRHLVAPEVCEICTLAPAADAPLRPLVRFPAVGPETPCAHLGALLRLEECPTCNGRVRVKVFACVHEDHDETTREGCLSCFDFEPQLYVAVEEPRRSPSSTL